MDEQYDVLVHGTGLEECILSGFLTVDGLKVRGALQSDVFRFDGKILCSGWYSEAVFREGWMIP